MCWRGLKIYSHSGKEKKEEEKSQKMFWTKAIILDDTATHTRRMSAQEVLQEAPTDSTCLTSQWCSAEEEKKKRKEKSLQHPKLIKQSFHESRLFLKTVTAFQYLHFKLRKHFRASNSWDYYSFWVMFFSSFHSSIKSTCFLFSKKKKKKSMSVPLWEVNGVPHKPVTENGNADPGWSDRTPAPRPPTTPRLTCFSTTPLLKTQRKIKNFRYPRTAVNRQHARANTQNSKCTRPGKLLRRAASHSSSY